MKNCTLAVTASIALALGACATQETPKPAPAPAPAPAAKPAPAPTPQPQVQVEPAKPVAKPAPTPAPAPKKPAVVNLASTELFEFNKATLTGEAKKKLDNEVIAKLRDIGQIRYIVVNGHADRLGSPQYNQRLSERRAEAVRAYLVSKGVDTSKVETLGFGKTLPEKSCPDQKDRKALIECLAPNRRVVVEIQGTPR
ncbi:MAG TPA: OmpA family protein [Burkholderiales bacterium]|nr:OmpA family protein [Burkholderiales bacterium]